MPTTRNDIRNWLNRPETKESTHMVVVCDTFDYNDYPVFVSNNENVHDVIKKYSNMEMSRVMEVYNLSMDIEAQLQERRAFNY